MTEMNAPGLTLAVSSRDGLLRSSRHLQTIAMVIGFAAIGAAIIEQQLNMAAAQQKGAANVGAALSARGYAADGEIGCESKSND